MLKRLCLRNFVLAKSLEVEFAPGLCIVSGETGAGKSLLVSALSLLAGGRVGNQKILPGAERAEIEAVFDADENSQSHAEVCKWLGEHELDDESGEVLARRVIRAGKTAAFINGRQVTVGQLAALAAMLMDISAQHEFMALKRAAHHRALLDKFAGAEAEVAAVAAAVTNWKAATARWREARDNETRNGERRRWAQAVVAECEALDFSDDKWRRMNETHNRVLHSADLAELCAQVERLLGDETVGAEKTVNEVLKCLAAMQRKDAAAGAAHIQTLNDALDLLRTVGADVAAYARRLQVDERLGAEAEHFVGECHRLARKYELADAERLGAFIGEQKAALAALAAGADVAALRAAADEAAGAARAACEVLSGLRRAAAAGLAQRINAALGELGMAKSRFSVALAALDEPTAEGMEKVTMQMRSRAGMAAANIGDIASGGELARLSLALQLVCGHTAPVSVFDEVDSGIGGAAADVVGRMLRQLGRGKQVICVTHLPQVAAHADGHWRVDGEPMTVAALSLAQQVEELARMQSGAVVTAEARASAKALIKSAGR